MAAKKARAEAELILPEELKQIYYILLINRQMPRPEMRKRARWRVNLVLPENAPLGKLAVDFLGTRGKILIASQENRKNTLYYCACLLQGEGEEIVKIYFCKEEECYFFSKESGRWTLVPEKN